MEFNLERSIEILERTPTVLKSLLHGLSDSWVESTEGPDTWSPRDVVAHLIHTEKTNWMPRLEIILAKPAEPTFPPFDRFGHLATGKVATLPDLLEEFKNVRTQSLEQLKKKRLSPSDLELPGYHPALGHVVAKQLLSAWTVHDLSHQAQVLRVLARQYDQAVGPWKVNLRILG